MGDGFHIIVDRDVAEADAPRLAERIRDWLISRRIVKPELTNCGLGDPGHPPGEAHQSVLVDPFLEAYGGVPLWLRQPGPGRPKSSPRTRPPVPS
jgi:hypothetical protein